MNLNDMLFFNSSFGDTYKFSYSQQLNGLKLKTDQKNPSGALTVHKKNFCALTFYSLTVGIAILEQFRIYYYSRIT